MANHKSAEKAHRQAIRRTEVNKSRKSAVKTSVRKVENALTTKNKEDAKTALRAAESELMRASSKGLLHKNTAARKISRLSARIKALFS